MGKIRNLIVSQKVMQIRSRRYFAAIKYATIGLTPAGRKSAGPFSFQFHHHKIDEDAMGNKDKRKEKKKPKQPKEKPKAGQSKSGALAPSR